MICDECETVAHCMKNGCVPKHQALERMAENARELGLDYEQQKPVAYWIPKAEQFCITDPSGRPFAKAWEPLYTSPSNQPGYQAMAMAVTRLQKRCSELERNQPAQREFVGLTDEEIEQGQKESWVSEQAWQSAVWWAVEKLKAKNSP